MALEDQRKGLPSIDALLRSEAGVRAVQRFGRPLFTLLLRRAVAEARDAGTAVSAGRLLDDAAHEAAATLGGAVRTINASGVLLHTGLGRAPLPVDASVAAAQLAAGYTDLEIDLPSGQRRPRTQRVETMICALCGSEDALMLNNGAAALFLTLATLAHGREVPVARGELIEIGGEFRLPDIIESSGALLVEVGTTNRTRVEDYVRAATPDTGAFLKVHPSNYRVVGFTSSASIGELATAASSAGVPLVFDAGSGMLQRIPGVSPDEPAVDEALRAGADLVLFSGDKLLGGPQAGVIAGRSDLVERIRHHPAARAMRVDKTRVAVMEAVLADLCTGGRTPLQRMLDATLDDLSQRAEELIASIDDVAGPPTAMGTEAVLGGGSTPGATVESIGVRLPSSKPTALARALRLGDPALVCRIESDAVIFDMRTVGSREIAEAATAIKAGLAALGP